MERQRETLAYFAGLFDGEGSIMITKQNRIGKTPWHKSPNYILMLNIAMTNREIIESWKTFFQVGWFSIRPEHKYKNAKNEFSTAKTSYYWAVKGNKALQVLHRLLPFLKVKKKQAEIGIKFQESKPLTLRTTSRGCFAQLSKEELSYREDARLQLKLLNTKVRREI